MNAIYSQPIMLMQETAGDLPLALRQLPAVRHSYHRGAVVYRVEQPADSVYLVLNGRVRLTRVAGDGRESVLHVLRGGEVFGEVAALEGKQRQEQASALDDLTVAAWPAAEVHRRAQQTPQLAAWFSSLLARRLQEAHDRIETLSFDPIPKRLARTILRHAQRFGTVLQDGRIRALPMTHEALAQEVATSREIITHHMNHFRARGLLNYSRKAIEVAPDRLASVLG
ncbi:MAG TPA: Crp/Fnr family transcriptional regulator [Terriglobales bacterium]|nr:Crp/Fnr family transcriptional regulator [Terriglobales bacterium]